MQRRMRRRQGTAARPTPLEDSNYIMGKEVVSLFIFYNNKVIKLKIESACINSWCHYRIHECSKIYSLTRLWNRQIDIRARDATWTATFDIYLWDNYTHGQLHLGQLPSRTTFLYGIYARTILFYSLKKKKRGKGSIVNNTRELVFNIDRGEIASRNRYLMQWKVDS